MGCGNKPSRFEKYLKARRAERRYFFGRYGVKIVGRISVRGRTLYSHSNQRHRSGLGRDFLQGRYSGGKHGFSNNNRPAWATEFASDWMHHYCRHAWLETFASEMKAQTPVHGEAFSATLSFTNANKSGAIGYGVDKHGNEHHAFNKATFTFIWDSTKHAWCEIQGFPEGGSGRRRRADWLH